MQKQHNFLKFINDAWDHSVIPALQEFIKIPNKSPAFDPQWQQHGYMEKALNLIVNWCQQQAIQNLQLQIVRAENRTPLLLLEIPGNSDQTVILYGHFDKQPEMTGWDEGLDPWQPVIKNERLYGRGGADDGYAVFAAVTAIKTLQQQNLPHPRCLVIIEACEESGSLDLPYYMELLNEKIGTPDLIICLDSGCGNYQQLWCTTSLRGLMNGVLDIKILQQGVHSGAASGIVPSSFRILRQLLNRIENETTGEILLPELKVAIPAQRIEEAKQVAAALQDEIWSSFPWVKHGKPITTDNMELILNKTWRAALSITGIAGIPTLNNAGNVLRSSTAVMLSIRTPPTCDVEKAAQALKTTLEKNPPYGAEVSFTAHGPAIGWNAPALNPELERITHKASMTFFEKPSLHWGEGGSIPFMGMLGKKFPQAQFIITGVLGPESNAHGPNEFLHIPFAKKLTACIAAILTDYFKAK